MLLLWLVCVSICYEVQPECKYMHVDAYFHNQAACDFTRYACVIKHIKQCIAGALLCTLHSLPVSIVVSNGCRLQRARVRGVLTCK